MSKVTVTWIDDNGYTWEWNNREYRLFCVEAEGTPNNGYKNVYSMWEAKQMLVDMGYLTE